FIIVNEKNAFVSHLLRVFLSSRRDGLSLFPHLLIDLLKRLQLLGQIFKLPVSRLEVSLQALYRRGLQFLKQLLGQQFSVQEVADELDRRTRESAVFGRSAGRFLE